MGQHNNRQQSGMKEIDGNRRKNYYSLIYLQHHSIQNAECYILKECVINGIFQLGDYKGCFTYSGIVYQLGSV